ncbi:MAG: TMEM43 family protein [Akkermansiaceae bacterium]|nr:TMEM43 family protein [Akkermansiaceae bacterium]
MAQDSFTETTTTGWFSRIGGAFKGIIFGVIAILASVVLLWFNEGRAVTTKKTLDEGAKDYVTVSSEKVDSANEGKLVYTTGSAATTDILRDNELNVSVAALKLRRVVEIYQWKEETESETKKKLGGSEETVTTYNYVKKWVDDPIDSSRFKKPSGHENPKPALEDVTKTAKPITVGAFTLSEGLAGSIGNFTPLVPEEGAVLPETLGGREVRAEGNGYYIGKDPANPEVGDMRVSHEVALPGEVSIISKQFGSSFEPYPAKAGGKIEMLEEGTRSAESMFASAQQSNKILTWILRGAGALIMFIGFSALFRPLSVIADVVPLIGSIVEVGTGFVALLLTVPLSLMVIAFAWVFYRPLIGIPLLLVAVAGIVFLIRKIMQAKKTRMATA